MLVHGGGKRITEWLERLGVPSRFEGGLRVTDAQSLEVAAAVLRGVVNSELVVGAARPRASMPSACPASTAGCSSPSGSPTSGSSPGSSGCAATSSTRSSSAARSRSWRRSPATPTGSSATSMPTTPRPGSPAGLGARQLVLLTDVDGVRDADGRRLDALTAGRGRDADRVRRDRRRHGAQGPGRARRARLGGLGGDHRRLVGAQRAPARPRRSDASARGSSTGGRPTRAPRDRIAAGHERQPRAQAAPPAGHPPAGLEPRGQQPARGRRRADRAGLRGHPGDGLARHHRARAAQGGARRRPRLRRAGRSRGRAARGRARTSGCAGSSATSPSGSDGAA